MNYAKKSNKADYDRYDLTIKLMPELHGRILEADQRNHFTEYVMWDCDHPLSKNFNYGCICGHYVLPVYNFILSFEVIEHLQNPLIYLRDLSLQLRPDGILILTTPIPSPIFPDKFDITHVHWNEFNKRKLYDLVELAGLKVTKYEKFNKSLRQYLKIGLIRPTLRWLFCGWHYVECQKI
jgi:SAM-dependent methyltransferase